MRSSSLSLLAAVWCLIVLASARHGPIPRGKVGLVLSFRIKTNSTVPPGVVATDRFTSIALSYAF